jgi:glutamate carboxypeptidase
MDIVVLGMFGRLNDSIQNKKVDKLHLCFLIMVDLRKMLEYFNENLQLMLRDAEELVKMESPSSDEILLKECSLFLCRKIKERTGLTVEEHSTTGTGPILVARSEPIPGKKPILLLCHYDTVHPKGMIYKVPFRVENGIVYGPGIFDMKIGIIQGIWSIKYLTEKHLLKNPLLLMLTPDEETGSLKSREIIEKEAQNCLYSIILEPSLNGKIKTRRKGVARYDIEFHGIAAHSGIEPDKGASAIKEMAQIILQVEELSNFERGTTVNVGIANGGSAVNVISEYAKISVDIRVWDNYEASRINDSIRALKTKDPRVGITISGGFNRPPMSPSEQTLKLVSKIKKLGKELNMCIEEASVGGGSDGNIIAPLGIPVIDGMGGDGGGAHTSNEFVRLETVVPRTAITTLFLADTE